MALWPFQGWPPAGQVACGHLTTPSDTPSHTNLLTFMVFIFIIKMGHFLPQVRKPFFPIWIIIQSVSVPFTHLNPNFITNEFLITIMGVWQGVVMDSLKYHLGPPCPSLLRAAGWPPLKQGGSAYRAGNMRSSSTPLGTPRRMVHGPWPMV
jgi:hypothetical protein